MISRTCATCPIGVIWAVESNIFRYDWNWSGRNLQKIKFISDDLKKRTEENFNWQNHSDNFLGNFLVCPKHSHVLFGNQAVVLSEGNNNLSYFLNQKSITVNKHSVWVFFWKEKLQFLKIVWILMRSPKPSLKWSANWMVYSYFLL